MALENSAWGQEWIGDELSLKLGLFMDPRTIAKYLKQGRPPRRPPAQRWATFILNHARAIVACDFFVSVTATFQILYVFVAMEIGARRILHCNATAHPTAEWTRQQFGEFLDGESGHRYVLHDRDSVFSAEVDTALNGFGVKVLKTPVRSPMANAYCERVIGSIRREILDHVIALNEQHLHRLIRDYVSYYHQDRIHDSLEKDTPNRRPVEHKPSPNSVLISNARLGGLHHRYS